MTTIHSGKVTEYPFSLNIFWNGWAAIYSFASCVWRLQILSGTSPYTTLIYDKIMCASTPGAGATTVDLNPEPELVWLITHQPKQTKPNGEKKLQSSFELESNRVDVQQCQSTFKGN